MTKTIAALASENPDITQVALRPKEIAVMLNVSAMTVATYLRNGTIPARKLGGATVILRDEFGFSKVFTARDLRTASQPFDKGRINEKAPAANG